MAHHEPIVTIFLGGQGLSKVPVSLLLENRRRCLLVHETETHGMGRFVSHASQV